MEYTEPVKNYKRYVLKILIVIMILLVIFLSEFYYRKPLYDISINIITDLQYEVNHGGSKFIANFMKLITHLGSTPLTIPLLIFFYMIAPLHITYRYMVIFSLSTYFTNLLKNIYYEARPFWVVDDPSKINPFTCNTGYGNPSGHAFTSSSCFLTTWWWIINYLPLIKSSMILKMLLLVICISMMILVMFSRLFLGVHTLNQLLFGCLLGTSLFLFFHYFFDFETQTGKKFFQLFSNKFYIIFHSFVFLGLFVAILIVQIYYKHSDFDNKYQGVLNKLCPHHSSDYEFSNNGFFNSLAIFGLIGTYYGMVLLYYLLQNYYSNKFIDFQNKFLNWNDIGIKQFMIKLGVLILTSGIPALLYVVVPQDIDMNIVFVFKVALPFFLSTFIMFGPAIYLFVKIRVVNEDLLLEDTTANGLLENQSNKEENNERINSI